MRTGLPVNGWVPPKPDPLVRDPLRTVILPRGALTRFLRIAESNTSLNTGVRGLLLGRVFWWWEHFPARFTVGGRSQKLVVTTLLIPQQRDTEHMSVLDEEELVWSLTEGRDLMPLGWVCFIFFLAAGSSDMLRFIRIRLSAFYPPLTSTCSLDSSGCYRRP